MNDDDTKLPDRAPSRPRKKSSGGASWDNLRTSWRRWYALPDDAEVEPSTIQSYLNRLVHEIQPSSGRPVQEPLEKVLEVLRSRVASAPTSTEPAPRTTMMPEKLATAPTASVMVAAVATPLPGATAAAEPTALSEPATTERRDAPVPPLARATSERTIDEGVIVGVIRAELRRSSDQQRKELSSLSDKIDTLSQSAASESRSTRSAVAEQGRQVETITEQMRVASHRVDLLVKDSAGSRQQVLAAIQANNGDMSAIRQQLEDLRTQIDHRVDLGDAKHVLRLREEIARSVRGELIREFSRMITPALGLLKETLSAGDTAAMIEAMDTLQKRCEQAGLIMDEGQLF